MSPSAGDRDRLAADLHNLVTAPMDGCTHESCFAGRIADRLIALGWTRFDEDALREAIVDIEEGQIDPRFWADDLPDDYEPPGLGCGDAAAIIERYRLLAAQHLTEPADPKGHRHTIPHPPPARLDEERLARALRSQPGWGIEDFDAAAIAKAYREDTE